MDIKSLRDIFHEQLKDMYSAEKQLAELLPELMDAASSPELKQSFEKHLHVTQNHVDTVRDILASMDINPGSKKCKAMEGLVEEGREMADLKGDTDTKDAGLICAAQKTEHYEIATYGTLCTWAKVLGEQNVAHTLQNILDEEYEANELLTAMAEGYINQQAKS